MQRGCLAQPAFTDLVPAAATNRIRQVRIAERTHRPRRPTLPRGSMRPGSQPAVRHLASAGLLGAITSPANPGQLSHCLHGLRTQRGQWIVLATAHVTDHSLYPPATSCCCCFRKAPRSRLANHAMSRAQAPTLKPRATVRNTASKFEPSDSGPGPLARAFHWCSRTSSPTPDPTRRNYSPWACLTLIAAETSGRVRHGAETDPGHVDVRIQRNRAFTGRAAILADTGERVWVRFG